MSAVMAEDDRMRPLYLEDFSVGDRVETRRFVITRKMIRGFAEVYDPQPMHLDEATARETVFGELVGSGWQTLAITMRLLVDAKLLGTTPIVGAEFRNIRFLIPVRPGDALRATAEVVGLRPSRSRPDRGFMELQVNTANESGAVVLMQNWTLLLPTRSGKPN